MICDSQDGTGSSLECHHSVASISVSSTDSGESVVDSDSRSTLLAPRSSAISVLLRSASLRMLASVNTISDFPDGSGSPLERDLCVASINFSSDAGEFVDTISDSPDVLGSASLHTLASLLIRSVSLYGSW
jgi:hypothetical protein